MTRRNWCLLASAALAIATPAAAQTTSVELATVVAASGERTVVLPGEILPFESVDIVARVAGYIDTLRVDRGDEVRRGDVLATLVAPEVAAQVAEARARAQAATARKVEAEAQLASATAAFEGLKTAAGTPGAVAALELQRAGEAMKGAAALVEANGKAVDAATAAADAIRALEGYLQVSAPFAGRITQRWLHPGALVGPTTGPLLRLEQVARLRVVVPVPERQFAGVALKRQLEFSVPAQPGRTFSGSVARVSGSLDAKTRTMAVELDVANTDGALAPGMFPDVKWPVVPASGAVLVPATAVVTTTERTFVIRVAGGRAQWITVKKGAARGDQVEVSGAMSPGETVVRRGSDEIRDGALVK